MTNKINYYIPAGQLVAAYSDATKIRYVTRDRNGAIVAWPDGGRPPYNDRPRVNMNTGAWQWDGQESFWLGYFNIQEFRGRRWDFSIVDVTESKTTYVSEKLKQNKGNYQWYKKA